MVKFGSSAAAVIMIVQHSLTYTVEAAAQIIANDAGSRNN
jgi:hypothetical protein